MKRYVLQVVIHEGNDEFWEEFEASIDGKTGVSEVFDLVNEALECHGIDFQLKMVEFTDK